jgi:hypothetical protein
MDAVSVTAVSILAVAVTLVSMSVFGGGLGLGGSDTSKSKKPTIWWYVDDRDPNTKFWTSFEDRATRLPTEPYLALCLQRAQERWSNDFTIVPITGRMAALAILSDKTNTNTNTNTRDAVPIPDGVLRTPPALWMAWLRCTMLANLGGLWIDGSVLPVGSGATLKSLVSSSPVLMFGTDADESLSVSAAAAGRSAGWAKTPHHPLWKGLSRDISAIVAQGDQSWSSFEARRSLRWLWDKHCSGFLESDAKVATTAEVSRTVYGKRLNYEDLFEKTQLDTVSITPESLWVPLPDGREKLEVATAFAWFTRLSIEQILESEFMWAQWARRS